MARGKSHIRSKSDSRKTGGQIKRDRAKEQRQRDHDVETKAKNEDMRQVSITELSRPHAAPGKVVIHYGPTNSGKTYQSRERLLEKFEAGELLLPSSGVYAAPLRMLAQENYEDIGSRIGFENVGLLTGEESVNPDAPIMCVTCEMTPSRGEILIVDEAHWLTDPSRGAVWTDAIARSSYSEMHIISAHEAAILIEALVSDAGVIETVHHQRFNQLKYGGQTVLADIPPRTAVVGFSKKLVHMLAQRLLASGKTVSVLYGNLPPHSRREQIAKFATGETDYIVTTDVIGHGVNLPIDNVVFAETTKYDGRSRRDLRTWEFAQIAGRAGRYNSLVGTAYALTGIESMEVNENLLLQGIEVANGVRRSDLNASAVHVAPQLDSLGFLNYSSEVSPRLTAWNRSVKSRKGLRPVHLDEYRSKMELIESELKIVCGVGRFSRTKGMQSDQLIHGLWNVLRVPVGHKSDAFLPLAIDVLYGQDIGVKTVLERVSDFPSDAGLEVLEKNVNTVRDIRLISRAFPELGLPDSDDLGSLESHYSSAIDEKIMASISATRYGHCRNCNRDVAPWLTQCSAGCRGKSNRDEDSFSRELEHSY